MQRPPCLNRLLLFLNWHRPTAGLARLGADDRSPPNPRSDLEPGNLAAVKDAVS